MEESDMDFKTWTDRQLLAFLIGEKPTQELMKGGLAKLVGGPGRRLPIHPIMCAARELVLRAFKQELRSGSALTSPGAVRDYFQLMFASKEHEVFVALFLDAQHRVIDAEELFQGTLTQTSVYPREVVKASLRWNAAAVIFAHNHPSGVAQPSQADELLTRNLKEALSLVDVKVLDHFIIAGNASISFAERGLL
jgi:DNA repair protein RadC